MPLTQNKFGKTSQHYTNIQLNYGRRLELSLSDSQEHGQNNTTAIPRFMAMLLDLDSEPRAILWRNVAVLQNHMKYAVRSPYSPASNFYEEGFDMVKVSRRPLAWEILSANKHQTTSSVADRTERLARENQDRQNSLSERLWWSER